ncbi:hypothetical protein [Aureispira anguillae]|uniref:Lipoprotein n=1 Tax=Aureispira anguillae TaxID=2864201 RepID=A0A915YIB2_9BACT|nr:hypothetical protein [Aureispira anguillae]BDS13575.1 hypothetical protein AsAng_0043140 [Aureispira anguillae]
MKLNRIHATLFFLMAITISWLTACDSTNSAPKAPDYYSFSKINCYVRYMAQNRELRADMTFRTDSTQAIDGAVTLNSIPMVFKKRPIVGLQYQLVKNSITFDNDYTFRYIEKNGQPIDLTIQLNDFDSLRIASKTVSKTTGGLLQWNGPALGHEDGLVFILTDSKGNTFSINHVGISKGNQFEIIADHANRLALGTATIETTRKKTTIQQENGTTRMLTVEYYSKPIEFEVID